MERTNESIRISGKEKLKAAKKRLQALENEVKVFESKHKLELKDHFDISLSNAKSKVMLNKDFQIVRNLKLAPSKTSNGFNYRFKGVEGRISYVGEQIRKAHFQIVCGLNAE